MKIFFVGLWIIIVTEESFLVVYGGFDRFGVFKIVVLVFRFSK